MATKEIKLEDIVANPYQPRKGAVPAGIEELRCPSNSRQCSKFPPVAIRLWIPQKSN
jgi:hypothetical protein